MDRYYGNDRKQPRCQGLVMDRGGFHMHQCLRKGVIEEYDTVKKCKRWWCRQHAPSAKAKRDEARMAKYRKESALRRRQHKHAALFTSAYAELIRLHAVCSKHLKKTTKDKISLDCTTDVLETIGFELDEE